MNNGGPGLSYQLGQRLLEGMQLGLQLRCAPAVGERYGLVLGSAALCELCI